MKLPYNLAFVLLGIYLREMGTSTQKHVHECS